MQACSSLFAPRSRLNIIYCHAPASTPVPDLLMLGLVVEVSTAKGFGISVSEVLKVGMMCRSAL
jgi:hypothetical protein